jgi:hypothetical protein
VRISAPPSGAPVTARRRRQRVPDADVAVRGGIPSTTADKGPKACALRLRADAVHAVPAQARVTTTTAAQLVSLEVKAFLARLVRHPTYSRSFLAGAVPLNKHGRQARSWWRRMLRRPYSGSGQGVAHPSATTPHSLKSRQVSPEAHNEQS